MQRVLSVPSLCAWALLCAAAPFACGRAAHNFQLPDAGPDAGPDGGDAGQDGGCATAANRPVAYAIDSCFSPAPDTRRDATLIDQACQATLSLDTIPTCTGLLSGPLDAFDGGCAAATYRHFDCKATSLPGVVHCSVSDAGPPPAGDAGTCIIRVCDLSDAGPDGGCNGP